jgi:hypothetical protein
MRVTVFAFGIIALLTGSYLYIYRTDAGLLSDATLLEIAASDVLGNPTYGKSCARSAYIEEVLVRKDVDPGGAAYFKFVPRPEKTAECPPLELLMSRRTAEGWLTTSK